jgi:hypothetical protein
MLGGPGQPVVVDDVMPGSRIYHDVRGYVGRRGAVS